MNALTASQEYVDAAIAKLAREISGEISGSRQHATREAERAKKTALGWLTALAALVTIVLGLGSWLGLPHLINQAVDAKIQQMGGEAILEAARKAAAEAEQYSQRTAESAAAAAKYAAEIETLRQRYAAELRNLEHLAATVGDLKKRVGSIGAAYTGNCWWQEVGYERSHELNAPWLDRGQEGAFIVQIDLDGIDEKKVPPELRNPSNWPIIGRAKYCRP
jgi:hypothetical protein